MTDDVSAEKVKMMEVTLWILFIVVLMSAVFAAARASAVEARITALERYHPGLGRPPADEAKK